MSSFTESHDRQSCRICNNPDLIPYLDLGSHPPSNVFLPHDESVNVNKYPLVVELCTECGNSQLSYVVAAAELFNDYSYLSSSSRALCEYYQCLVDTLLQDFTPPDNSVIVDIGANDGIMLDRYPPDKFKLIGIEPSSAADMAEAKGHTIIRSFFDEDAVSRIREAGGPAAIVTATNVFAHVDDIKSFCQNIYNLLDTDGVFVIEFPYLIDTIEQMLFDTIYHEHLSYFALTPLMRLFEDAGLRIFRAERTAFGASGPALRVCVCRTGSSRATEDSVGALLSFEQDWGICDPRRYQKFAGDVAAVRDEIRTLVADIRTSGQQIGCYTAPAKGNTLLNYIGFGPDDIVAIAENNERKIGRVTPGTFIPVVSDKDFLDMKLPYALLLSWNYADHFVKHSEYAKQGGRYIIPLPKPVIRARDN